MIHNPSPFTATMKLLFTWPRGFRSAMSSTLGSAPGASVVLMPSPTAGTTYSCGPSEKSLAPVGSNCNRCEIGRSGAPLNSKPSAAPTTSPNEAGIIARGGPGNVPGIAPELAEDRNAGSIAAAPAANAVEPPFVPADAAADAAAADAARAAGNPGIGRA